MTARKGTTKILSTPKPAAPPALAFSVPEFCCTHRISRSHFYALLRNGLGPRLIQAGGRTLISVEAAAEWRSRCERAA